ncbi:hypothetical protein [Serratia ureilytica]|uniref:hypothetical protein n=1 Tax=Serratia ureilytica TaxID=300181 RepID=UPI001D18E304|nr:hypothetical protein [Serratia ureilytica]MCC4106211.1 hypothetical protein [Serratia ureilytica]
MNKKYTIFVFYFLLSGCGNYISFEPNKLPNGCVGQEYYIPITITGGTGPVVDLSYEIHPLNSGLKLVFNENKYYTRYIYNDFSIQGRPKSQGVVTISIKGGVVASAGQDFAMKYEINALKNDECQR